MLKSIIATVPGGELILEYVEYAALAIEILAVLIIIVSIFYAIFRYTLKVSPGSRSRVAIPGVEKIAQPGAAAGA